MAVMKTFRPNKKQTAVESHPYNSIGLKLFVISGILISVYLFSYNGIISATGKYIENTCKIKTIEIVDVDINCENTEGYISVVKMPCILAIVDSKNYTDIKFYRSYEERLWILEQRVNCSYLPSTCQHDPRFTKRILQKSYKNYFPSELSEFSCYTTDLSNLTNETNDIDALLYIPDKRAYYLSITTSAFGIILSIGFAIFAAQNKTNKKSFLNHSLYKKMQEEIDMISYDTNNPKFHYQYVESDDYKTSSVTEETTFRNSRATRVSDNDDENTHNIEVFVHRCTGRISAFSQNKSNSYASLSKSSNDTMNDDKDSFGLRYSSNSINCVRI